MPDEPTPAYDPYDPPPPPPTAFVRPAADPYGSYAPPIYAHPLTTPPPEPPRQRSPVAMAAVFVVIVLVLAGGIVGGYLLFRSLPRSAASPPTAAGSAESDLSREYPSTFRLANRIGDLRHTKNSTLLKMEQVVRKELSKTIMLEKPFAAAYEDTKHSSRPVVVFGTTQRILSPESLIDHHFETLADNEGTRVTSVEPQNSGFAGGHVRCGHLVGRVDTVVCGWADHGSFGFVMCPNRTVGESVALLDDIRRAIIIRPQSTT